MKNKTILWMVIAIVVIVAIIFFAKAKRGADNGDQAPVTQDDQLNMLQGDINSALGDLGASDDLVGNDMNLDLGL